MVSAVINGDLHPFERYWVKHIFHELLKILCEKVFRKTLVLLIDSWLLCAFSLLLSILAFFSNWIIPWTASHERRRENLNFSAAPNVSRSKSYENGWICSHLRRVSSLTAVKRSLNELIWLCERLSSDFGCIGLGIVWRRPSHARRDHCC